MKASGISKGTRDALFLAAHDIKGQATTFTYDAADLKTKMTYPDTSYQAWTYDNAKNLISRRTVNGAKLR